MSSQPTSSTDLLARAPRVADVAARHAAGADMDRNLHPDVVEGILDAGFARHYVPTRWGGTAGTSTDLLHATAEIGTGCTSAAWCASVLAGSARLGAYLSDEGQQELWAKGADTAIVGAMTPRGSATVLNDGWRVTGEWDFTSGVGFSDWALACGLVPTENGPEPWFFALPREDYRMEDTWSSVGMRGTASNTLVLDNVFVPRHRGYPRSAMINGLSVESEARCHTAPLRLVSGLLFAAPALGAARGALRIWSDHMAATEATDASSSFGLIAARAAIGIDAAGLLLERAARVADSGSATETELARNPADCALSVEQLVDVVERLYRSVGSSGHLTAHPIQRVWRDMHSLASHVALRFDSHGGAYGAHVIQPYEHPR